MPFRWQRYTVEEEEKRSDKVIGMSREGFLGPIWHRCLASVRVSSVLGE